jgi:hypothetical protein
MSGKQGKPVPLRVKQFIIDTARDDPSRTNSDIEGMTTKKFKWSPREQRIGYFRKEAGIPSSREAKALLLSSPPLTSEQKAYIQKLLDKLVLPDPDTLKASEVVRDRGSGMIGSRDERIHVRFDDNNLTEYWLSETELETLNSVATGMKDVPNLRLIYEEGIKIIGDILSHNWRIELGSGDPTFRDVLQLLETRDPDRLPAPSKLVDELWNRYAAFGKELDMFKKKVSDSLNPFSISG